MIFRCYICKDYKFWNKQCFEVIVTGNDGTKNLFTKKLCKGCGEGIDEVYQSGKAAAAIEVREEDDREADSVYIP